MGSLYLSWRTCWTWCAPGSDCMARIDFILIPSSWVAGENASWVSLDIDPGHKSSDHLPVLLDFWTCAGKSKRRGFDRRAMASCAGKEKLRAICQNLPLQPWSMEADTHSALLQQHIVRELTEAFPALGFSDLILSCLFLQGS